MRAAATDANQQDIIDALRAVGATVISLHRVGMGCPDLAVGFRGVNLFLEVKDGSKPASAQKLTPAQKEWHGVWRGQVCVVRSVDGALAAIGMGPKASKAIPFKGAVE